MRDDQLLRYSRHILLDEWGIRGQERVSQSHALIVGAGGLGSPAALYLASAGVGHISLIDHDHVDVTNLQRQIAHSQARVGQFKVASLQAAMQADAALLAVCLPSVDVVLDCTDNFETRQLINQACAQYAKPLVSGSALRFDGQVAVYDTRQADAPCYACVFPPTQSFEEERCATMGVLAPLVGVIGSMQATEALKLLSGMGSSLQGKLMMFNAQHMEWQTVSTARNLKCSVCSPFRAKS
jgi:molybdopterin/thiamine biosynthesis adenylyltransferase